MPKRPREEMMPTKTSPSAMMTVFTLPVLLFEGTIMGPLVLRPVGTNAKTIQPESPEELALARQYLSLLQIPEMHLSLENSVLHQKLNIQETMVRNFIRGEEAAAFFTLNAEKNRLSFFQAKARNYHVSVESSCEIPALSRR